MMKWALGGWPCGVSVLVKIIKSVGTRLGASYSSVTVKLIDTVGTCLGAS